MWLVSQQINLNLHKYTGRFNNKRPILFSWLSPKKMIIYFHTNFSNLQQFSMPRGLQAEIHRSSSPESCSRLTPATTMLLQAKHTQFCAVILPDLHFSLIFPNISLIPFPSASLNFPTFSEVFRRSGHPCHTKQRP